MRKGIAIAPMLVFTSFMLYGTIQSIITKEYGVSLALGCITILGIFLIVKLIKD